MSEQGVAQPEVSVCDLCMLNDRAPLCCTFSLAFFLVPNLQFKSGPYLHIVARTDWNDSRPRAGNYNNQSYLQVVLFSFSISTLQIMASMIRSVPMAIKNHRKCPKEVFVFASTL